MTASFDRWSPDERHAMTCILKENMFPLPKFTANLLKFMARMFLSHRIMQGLGHGSGAVVTLYKDQKIQTKASKS